MIKIVFWNLFILTFIIGSYTVYIHKKYVSGPLTGNAVRGYQNYKKHPEYHPNLDKVSWLTYWPSPTSFVSNKPDMTKIRVGCFGDSHTQGDETAPGNDYPSVLQKILGDRYQVINFGNGGHGFHQIYTLIDHYIDRYKLDYIIIGPRGFYTYRSMSFNNYWNQGSIPYAQYKIKDDKLVVHEVRGKTTIDKAKRYYGFFPSMELLFDDHVPPSFLKLSYMRYRKEMENPFFKENIKETRRIQRRQIIEIANRGAKLIHYTDFSKDCRAFKDIKHKNYSLTCIEPFIHKFPYLAEMTHPSAFGYYYHAKDIAQLILKSDKKISKIKFHDYQNQIIQQKFKVDDQNLEIHKLSTFLESRVIACLKSNRGYTGIIGEIKSYDNQTQKDQDSVLIGVYMKGEPLASALFLKIPKRDPILENLKNENFYKLKSIPNLYFYELEESSLELSRNVIHSDRDLLKSPLIKTFFTHTKDYTNHYHPKYPTLKMVVDEKLSAYEILRNEKRSELKVEMKLSALCPYSIEKK